MILSDVTIREELAAGRIVIEPLRDGSVQPSSVDLHCDRYFRVFRNDTTPFIDPKQPQEDLTELVEVPDGRAFILHPGEFVLGSTLERVALPDDLVARLEGKALALDTEVPTPFGWTTMGDLAPGDLVFDERGEPTRVVAATEPFLDRPCREVVFSDGTTVVADVAHLWSTVDTNGRRHGRRVAKVRATEVIAHSLLVRGERNHQVELTEPVAYPERELPIDPYVLGSRLGDAREGLLGNKHVPADYLRASIAQRTAFLQGLMDSDGYVDKLGRCDFTSIHHGLAEQVCELAASLGFRATLAKKRAMLNGVDCGTAYEVQFTPDRPVFRLPRKLARQKTTGRFHRFRAIVDVRVVPPVPVRCIQVAAPSGQFLVTRSYVPTHNSSLGRLGLLIHSSLPASEPVMVLQPDGRLEPRPIGEIVAKRLDAKIVGFDPETFEVGYHDITGWYEGPADRIFEVQLGSGRRVRVTAGHNLFTLDRDGDLSKVRTGELRPGTMVAIPRLIPDLVDPCPAELDLLGLVPDSDLHEIVCEGETVRRSFDSRTDEVTRALLAGGYAHADHYRRRSRIPLPVALQVSGLVAELGPNDGLGVRGARHSAPCRITVDGDVAWLLGLYIAEGSRRRNQVVFSNTDQSILDRVERVLRRLELPIYRTRGAVTCCSTIFSKVLGWLHTGDRAQTKRVPPLVFSWNRVLIEAFIGGLVDGDGSRESSRTSIWTTSDGLVGDLLVLFARLGRRAGTSWRDRGKSPICQLYVPTNEHKLLTSVPLPDRLLVNARRSRGLDQRTAAQLAGYKHPTDLCNIENRINRDAVRFSTLRRLRDAYRSVGEAAMPELERLTEGGLAWDRVVEVRDTGSMEPIFDLEVQPGGRKIENFLAGHGGVFVSNTAGFVDAGWDGHLTLELSNVANLPIAIYPGMKIGQISFLRMTTAAENPYGSKIAGSKYQGQRGPTPSRYYLNFRDEPTETA